MPTIRTPGSMMKSGKDVKDTKVISGTASKDSLTGTNTIKPHVTSGSGFSGPYGGKPSYK